MAKTHKTGPPRAGTLYPEKLPRAVSYSVTRIFRDIVERIHARVGFSRSEVVEHIVRQHGETTVFPATAKHPYERGQSI